MLRVNQLTGFGLGGPRTPQKAEFGNDTSSIPGTIVALTVAVKPGLLVFAIAYEETGIAPVQPTAVVNGQGSATHKLTKFRDEIGISWFYFEGNTTNGSQAIDFTFGTTTESFSIGCWSFLNGEASDILTSASGSTGTGAAVPLTWAGAATSFVLQACCTRASNQSATGDPDLTTDANGDTGADAGDHEYRYLSGTGSVISDGDVDGDTSSNTDYINTFVEVSGV